MVLRLVLLLYYHSDMSIRIIGLTNIPIEKPASSLREILKMLTPIDDLRLTAMDSIGESTLFSENEFDCRLARYGFSGALASDNVSIWVDNQLHFAPRRPNPFSWIEIAVSETCEPYLLERSVIQLVEAMSVQFAVVLIPNEGISLYHKSRHGLGSGLIDVFWIMAFDREYSKLIDFGSAETLFYRRESFHMRECTVFVSAATLQEYKLLSAEKRLALRSEIGLDLFSNNGNGFTESTNVGGASEVSSVFSPRNLLKFVSAAIASRRAGNSELRAKRIPERYL